MLGTAIGRFGRQSNLDWDQPLTGIIFNGLRITGVHSNTG